MAKQISLQILKLISKGREFSTFSNLGTDRFFLPKRDNPEKKPNLLPGVLRGPEHLFRHIATVTCATLSECGNTPSSQQAEQI